MNCPGHVQIFNHHLHSYKDLPLKYAEFGCCHRKEPSGSLHGLIRVRSFVQDDGHIFCRVSQIKQEVKTMVDVILEFYKKLGMDKGYWVSLSVRDDDMSKYLGEDKVWKIAEKALQDVANERKLPFKKIEGEAAFYGPKLDFMFFDALGRERQLSTIQLDFNLPERFNLSFMNDIISL